MNFTEILQNLTKKPLADCTDQELYLALLELCLLYTSPSPRD